MLQICQNGKFFDENIYLSNIFLVKTGQNFSILLTALQ